MRPWLWILGGVVLGSGIALTRPEVRAAVSNAADKIKELIAGSEGLRTDAYQDVAGKWTIGYGHLIQPGEPYHPYGTVREISTEEADALFARDTSIATGCVNESVTVPLTDNQRAALVSFVFNVGCGAFRNSTLLKKLNSGDYESAADELTRWVNAGGVRVAGLVNRRNLEREVFLA